MVNKNIFGTAVFWMLSISIFEIGNFSLFCLCNNFIFKTLTFLLKDNFLHNNLLFLATQYSYLN